jgi:small subunit ribosomal protein S8
MQDPIADLCTRIRNAQAVRKEKLSMPASNIKFAIAEILKAEGYINDVVKSNVDNKPVITITLKYHHSEPVINLIQRVSKPSLRVYKGAGEMPKVPGFGIAIVTTSKGIMTAKSAKKMRIGGEIICIVN